MTSFIIPIIFISVLVLGAIKRQSAYDSFVSGAGKALNLIKNVFPYLCAVMIAVEIFKTSGLSVKISQLIAPVMNAIGLPSELTELIIIRPLSGAGALAVVENIFSTYGVDSYVGNCASIVYGSSETVFYLASIYFSGCNVKRLGYAIPLALLCNFTGYVVGCAFMRFM